MVGVALPFNGHDPGRTQEMVRDRRPAVCGGCRESDTTWWLKNNIAPLPSVDMVYFRVKNNLFPSSSYFTSMSANIHIWWLVIKPTGLTLFLRRSHKTNPWGPHIEHTRSYWLFYQCDWHPLRKKLIPRPWSELNALLRLSGPAMMKLALKGVIMPQSWGKEPLGDQGAPGWFDSRRWR